MASVRPARNSMSVQRSAIEIRDYLIYFYNQAIDSGTKQIPRGKGWQELKDFVRSWGCESVTWAHIDIDPDTKLPTGHGYSTVKNRDEAIRGYYRFQQWNGNPLLVTLWEGRPLDSTSGVTESVPSMDGEGRAANIRYRLFTLPGEVNSNIQSSECMAGSNSNTIPELLETYEKEVLGDALRTVSPPEAEQRARVSEQVFHRYIKLQAMAAPQFQRPSHLLSDCYRDKAVEAKNYMYFYLGKRSSYAFPALLGLQVYGQPADQPSVYSLNSMGSGYLTTLSPQTDYGGFKLLYDATGHAQSTLGAAPEEQASTNTIGLSRKPYQPESHKNIQGPPFPTLTPKSGEHEPPIVVDGSGARGSEIRTSRD